MISGNHFRHPIAQSVEYAVSIVIIARMILPEPGIAQSGDAKIARTRWLVAHNTTACDQLGDYFTALEYEASDLTRRIRDREDKRHVLITYEEKHFHPQGATGKWSASQRRRSR
jgi:hypothetical protein